MGRAIDLFVTYRFIKLLVTPFEKTDAFKLGIIDEKGVRTKKGLYKAVEQNAYTVLHKLVFNIKKIFQKVPGLRTKLGTYAAALFLLKDTFKEHIEDPEMFEKEENMVFGRVSGGWNGYVCQIRTISSGNVPAGPPVIFGGSRA